MKYAGARVDNHGAASSEINVETAPDKPVEPLTVEQTQTTVKAVEPAEAVQERADENLDLWMKNIKEFIRNIDVKSL
jgi:uncharacterized protein YPO0396